MLITYMVPFIESDIKKRGDGGWGTPTISALTCIGAFCENSAAFEKGINLFKNGPKSVYGTSQTNVCCGVLDMINADGQSYDTGRDLPHAQFLMYPLFMIAVVAYNQKWSEAKLPNTT